MATSTTLIRWLPACASVSGAASAKSEVSSLRRLRGADGAWVIYWPRALRFGGGGELRSLLHRPRGGNKRLAPLQHSSYNTAYLPESRLMGRPKGKASEQLTEERLLSAAEEEFGRVGFDVARL